MPPSRRRGFTLIEVLVAISIMALMAVLSWRGLDGMMRAQTQTREHTDAVLTLQAGLGQWKSDLDALVTPDNGLNALDWDGRVLRLTRRSSTAAGDGLWVVAWTRRSDNPTAPWLRWQSPPVSTWGAWREAWARARRWGQTPDAQDSRREVTLFPLSSWQIFYFRGNAWTHPLSSDGAATPAGETANTPVETAAVAPALPDGIRLILDLAPGAGLQGPLTVDWVRPTVGGGKS